MCSTQNLSWYFVISSEFVEQGGEEAFLLFFALSSQYTHIIREYYFNPDASNLAPTEQSLVSRYLIHLHFHV